MLNRRLAAVVAAAGVLAASLVMFASPALAESVEAAGNADESAILPNTLLFVGVVGVVAVAAALLGTALRRRGGAR